MAGTPDGSTLKAVIFDVDGVLVQSMERHHEAYRRVFAELRVDIKRDEVFSNEGRRSREVIESLARARGLRLTTEQLEDMNRQKQEVFASFGALPLYPGIPELIAKLKDAKLRVAAVTGTSRQNVERHMGPLIRKFDVIVTADDVTHTKPHPEPYLAALDKLAIQPGEAVVIENAPLGIQSAKAANLRVFGVTSTLPAERLKEADRVLARVQDVWALVEVLR